MDQEKTMPQQPPAKAYNQLSPRHQRVIDGLAEGLTQGKAGIKAGYSESAAGTSVSRLMKKPEMRESLRERREQLAAASHYTRIEMMADLAQARDLAFEKGQAAAAVTAITAMGKLAGLTDETLTVKHEGEALTSMSELITRFTESAIEHQRPRKTLPNSRAKLVDHGEWIREQAAREGRGQNGDQAAGAGDEFGGAGLIDPPPFPDPGPSEEQPARPR